MKTSIKSLLVVMAITGAVGAGLAYALPPGGAPACPHGAHGERAMNFEGHGGYADSDRMIEHMAASLNLSKQQRDAMYAIVDKARPQTRELRDRLIENHKQLRALTQQGAPKESEVRKLADAQGKAIADMIVLRTKIRTEIRGVLTDAQRQQLDQWRKQRGGRLSYSDRDGAARDLSNVQSLNSPTPSVSKVMM
ncbi:MAG TPA: Spy/CpxP family protein refolding chaperone [Candidatus Methylomirabilis sp.]|nr:Spy/CpxP family protein refolding chaperone [Candidatus Methylomirabilis sp.]